MIEALALCFVLFDRASYDSTMLFEVPPETTDAWADGQIDASERLWDETGGDPALWLPALHDARRAADAMTGEEMPAALTACEDGA